MKDFYIYHIIMIKMLEKFFLTQSLVYSKDSIFFIYEQAILAKKELYQFIYLDELVSKQISYLYMNNKFTMRDLLM